MAECFDEFDAPSPMPARFCSRISLQEYEANASKHTEEGLQQLLDYLQYNPTVYYDILAKRSREESDNAGLFSYLRNRITEWYTGGADAGGSVDPEEAKRQLSGLKNSIVKSFNYSQEAKGSTRRFSARIAEKRWRKVSKGGVTSSSNGPLSSSSSEGIPMFPRDEIEQATCEFVSAQSSRSTSYTEKKKDVTNTVQLSSKLSSSTTNNKRKTPSFPVPPTNIPPPPPLPPSTSFGSSKPPLEFGPKIRVPPPPPPPPPPSSNQMVSGGFIGNTGTAKPKENNQQFGRAKEARAGPVTSNNIVSQRRKLRSVSHVHKTSPHQGNEEEEVDDSAGGFTQLMDAIKKPGNRIALKQISNNKRSEGNWVTPPRKKFSAQEDAHNMFNMELLRRFQNAKSPLADSPSAHDMTWTSP